MDKKVKIAIDLMGGENSPDKNIDGIELFIKRNKNLNDYFFYLFGNEDLINEKIKKKALKNFKIFDTKIIVSDDLPALSALKKGKDSSMWKTIESQNSLSVDVSLSAGNTGVMLVMSKMILKTLEDVDKPALAGLWPNKKGMNVVLDLGANIECSSKNLVDFSIMGASLYKSLYPQENPNVALLNIGSEELKGNETIKETFQIMNNKKSDSYNFAGYIEGNEIMNGDVNVIVSDGFTGNVALKTAEGTANFITSELKLALSGSIIGKFSSLLNISNLRKFKKRLDPRLYNGAIFIGLDAPVVKSHGGTDYFGFSNSISVCNKIVKGNLIKKINENIE